MNVRLLGYLFSCPRIDYFYSDSYRRIPGDDQVLRDSDSER